ncbi:unnamed protein product [Microthlaspi erraticum]|uniref:Uncharacterized protein n=1 Tax=Microthlaspi erraticum TaxID=1685480 RepID=A0A6D2HGG1_9BRAS|nr:unnamed protein product [Microthlaspi erraticum]
MFPSMTLCQKQLMAAKIVDRGYLTKCRLEEERIARGEEVPWYADFVNYLVCRKFQVDGVVIRERSSSKMWFTTTGMNPICSEKGMITCSEDVAKEEVEGILFHCHGQAMEAILRF